MYVLHCYPIRSLELAICLGYPAYFNGNEYFYGHSDPGSDMARRGPCAYQVHTPGCIRNLVLSVFDFNLYWFCVDGLKGGDKQGGIMCPKVLRTDISCKLMYMFKRVGVFCRESKSR